MKKFLTLAIILISAIGCGSRPKETVNKEIREAYNATCRVDNIFGCGTGVLLNTGYIITAGHVVDIDKDGKLSPLEIEGNWVEFTNNGIAELHSATVIFMGNWSERDDEDVAILQIANPPESNINILNQEQYGQLLYGDLVYTIGMTNGSSTRITDGRLDNLYKSDQGMDRTTCDIYRGNSGGGLFDANTGNLLGIVTQGYRASENAEVDLIIPIPTENNELSFVRVSGNINVPERMTNWSEFVNASQISFLMKTNNLRFVIEKPFHISPLVLYTSMLLNLIMLFVITRCACALIELPLRKTMRRV